MTTCAQYELALPPVAAAAQIVRHCVRSSFIFPPPHYFIIPWNFGLNVDEAFLPPGCARVILRLIFVGAVVAVVMTTSHHATSMHETATWVHKEPCKGVCTLDRFTVMRRVTKIKLPTNVAHSKTQQGIPANWFTWLFWPYISTMYAHKLKESWRSFRTPLNCFY